MRFIINKVLKPGIQLNKRTYSIQCEEVRIPMPWGQISGQWWGVKTKRPILAIHGWRENAASFEPLALKLSNHIPILSIDLPGCGLSTHLPPGNTYNANYCMDVHRIIMQHYQWDQISLLGHSMGSGINFLFAACYPDLTDFVIGLDGLVLPHPRTAITAKIYRNVLDEMLDITKNSRYTNGQCIPIPRKHYTYDEACDEIVKLTFHSLDRKYAPLLLQRELSEIEPGKFVFRMDPRVQLRAPGWCREQLECFATTITSPLLNIKSNNWRYVEGEECYKTIMDIIRKRNEHLEIAQVDGGHHVHVMQPELIAPIILNFIRKNDKSQRI